MGSNAREDRRLLSHSEGVCRELHAGLVLPLFEAELGWPDGLRGVLYGAAMIYTFLGVSIVADIFMGAIEAITSRRRQAFLPNGKVSTTRVWNDTVSNLTLMALGSSAPEILLSVIDLIKHDMFLGELGPQTIVGSASFNLFMIVGLCIVVIPSTEARKIRQMQVFFVTTVFMLLAYLWLVVTISVTSPGIIDIWEAVVTLAGLPVLVLISYLVDIGKINFDWGSSERKFRSTLREEDISRACALLEATDRDMREAVKVTLALRPKNSPPLETLSTGELERLKRQVKRNCIGKRSRAARRVEATRALTGGRKIPWDVSWTFNEHAKVGGVLGASLEDVPVAQARGTGRDAVQFAAANQCMSSELTLKQVMLTRTGEQDGIDSLRIQYTVNIIAPEQTPPRSSMMRFPNRMSIASEGMYERRKGSFGKCLTTDLGPGEWRKHIPVQLPEGFAQCETAVGLAVDLVSVEGQASRPQRTARNFSYKSRKSGTQLKPSLTAPVENASVDVGLGVIMSTEIDMVASGSAGYLGFCFDRMLIQGTDEPQTLEVLVQRVGGCSGTVSCTYRTERLTAIPGHDFVEVEGELEFPEGVTEQFIDIEILPKGKFENKDDFLVVLENAEGGAKFKPCSDGGEDAEILTVTIGMWSALAESKYGDILRRLDAAMNFDALRLGSTEWKEAFAAAVFCNGSLKDQKEASPFDWAFHLLSLPWKLFFAFIPPTAYFHGWACFWVSLAFIGACTAIIGDLAELFGCVLSVPDTMTAIVFVALGTSMPDLFASKTAATQDPFADASIVNVTGSNSVNVFLGLGLPWTIGAIYWRVRGRTAEWTLHNPKLAGELPIPDAKFVAPADGLTFSVACFAIGAFVAVYVLILRRHAAGGELGGPFKFKVFSSLTLVLLWFVDVSLVGWWTIRRETASAKERAVVFVGSSCVVGLGVLVTTGSALCCKATPREGNEATTAAGEDRSSKVDIDTIDPDLFSDEAIAIEGRTAVVASSKCPTPFLP